MGSKPLVSVIMIFFNAERFIREAIESVFAQSYDNWELLLVDDGSTDGSTEIALRYASEYPEKVRYLEHDGHQNRGMSASRNLGIWGAKGDYIALLDSDDVWFPDKLAQQVAILDSFPEAAMVYGNRLCWASWTGNPEDIQGDSISKHGIPADVLVRPPALFTLTYGLGKTTNPGSDVMFRREVAMRVGGFEEAFRGMYEDQAFLVKVYLQEAVFVSSHCWTKYRQHSDSCVSAGIKTGEFKTAWPSFLNWIEDYVSQQRIKDRAIEQVIRNALFPYRHPSLLRLLRASKAVARRTLPVSVRRWLQARWRDRTYCPPVGWVRFGSLRRLIPISRVWGYDRGRPIDRYYIEKFLAHHAADIRGRVLEIGDDAYTRKFGGHRVTQRDVLHVREGNPKATIVADLTCADQIPSDTVDCIIFTQTLQLIFDVRAALWTLHRIMKPGGVLLATFPGISRASDSGWGDDWYWSFTPRSAQRLFEAIFPQPNVRVEAYGNVLAAISFLHGLAVEDLRAEELDQRDPGYEVSITVRAVKPGVAL